MKSVILKVSFLALLLSLAACQLPAFPLYMQCDPRWGSIPISLGPDTICEIGCLLASASMLLAGYNVTLDNQTATPEILNDWLNQNNGYNGYNFLFETLDELGFMYMGDLNQIDQVNAFIQNENYVVFLHVAAPGFSGHYVLATGVNSTGITVMDPFYNVTMYNFSAVIDAPLYYLDMAVIQQNQYPIVYGEKGFLETF